METENYQKDSIKIALCLKLLLNQRLKSLTYKTVS